MGKQSWKPGNMLNPVPAVMVSVADEAHRPNIITVAWAGTICTNPPMVSISVRPSRYSYDIIEKTGNIPERDMFNTFNMGVGMSITVAPEDADRAVRILREIRRISSYNQVHVHASVRKNQQKQILENFHYWNPFLFVGIGCFQSRRNMKSRKKSLYRF